MGPYVVGPFVVGTFLGWDILSWDVLWEHPYIQVLYKGGGVHPDWFDGQ